MSNAASPEDRPSFMMEIRAGDLNIDRRYQPEDRYDERRAERIASEWDWARYQPLQVGIYDDHSAWIIDGQHRWNAAKMVFGPDVKLPCYIVGQVSVEDAARIFANADKNRIRVGEHHKLAAMLAAKDPDALNIVETLASHGWTLVTNNSSGSRNVTCVATINRVYRDKKGGPHLLDQTMRIVTLAWGYHSKASSAAIIGGVSRFLKMHASDPRFDEDHLVRRLREASIDELIGPEAGAIAVKLGTRVSDQNHLAIALAIRDRYNRSRRTHTKLGVHQHK